MCKSNRGWILMQMAGTGRKITIWFKEGEIFNIFELGILTLLLH